VRPGAWLERVGLNAAIDRWRLERRRQELAPDLDPPAQPLDPEAGVLQRERQGVLRRALVGLPRPLRRATLARFHADLPFDAVASRLGTEPVTARTRVHRALERLRARVGGLRAWFVWVPGAQAAVLGVTLVAGVARLSLFPPGGVAPSATLQTSPARGFRVAASPTPASAAPPVPAPAPPSPPARAPRHAVGEPATPPPSAVQRYSYDDDEVTGDLARPDGIALQSAARVQQPSLIELRLHFVPEILETLEGL
jgi:hypothetical protein